MLHDKEYLNSRFLCGKLQLTPHNSESHTEEMGQDIYRFTAVPGKFKDEKGNFSPMQPEVFPEKQELFATDNTAVGDEKTCALCAQDFEDIFQIRCLF